MKFRGSSPSRAGAWARAAALAVAAAFSITASVAYAAAPTPSPEALAGLDAHAAVELANAWKGAPDVTSFATSEALVVRFEKTGEQAVVPMPEDAMLVSVAPYFERTHPCETHFLSSCQGELVDVPVEVHAFRPSGETLFVRTMSTGANGFVDLWLPRDEALVLRFRVGDAVAEGLVATYDGSATCVTAMRLRASVR